MGRSARPEPGLGSSSERCTGTALRPRDAAGDRAEIDTFARLRGSPCHPATQELGRHWRRSQTESDRWAPHRFVPLTPPVAYQIADRAARGRALPLSSPFPLHPTLGFWRIVDQFEQVAGGHVQSTADLLDVGECGQQRASPCALRRTWPGCPQSFAFPQIVGASGNGKRTTTAECITGYSTRQR